MTTTALTTIKSARKAADYLESIGQHKFANDVRAVCRSNETYRGTLGQMRREIEELRKERG